jgi:hypothetical protein
MRHVVRTFKRLHVVLNNALQFTYVGSLRVQLKSELQLKNFAQLTYQFVDDVAEFRRSRNTTTMIVN